MYRGYCTTLACLVLLVTSWMSEAKAYYGPHTGRFINRDPIEYHGGSASLYEYVHSNPGVHVDPSGLANFWNPISWFTVPNPHQSWGQFFNPISDENLAWWAGTGQGAVNTVNGLQDAAIGVVNLPLIPINYLAGADGIGYIPSPQWAEGMITEEDPCLHKVSTFTGGQSLFFLVTLGTGSLAQGGQGVQLVHATRPGATVGQTISGPHGVFGTARPNPTWWQIGFKPGGAVQIPGGAAGTFRPIPTVGPISGWTGTVGQGYWAPVSQINLATGATRPLGLAQQWPIAVDAMLGQAFPIVGQASTGIGLPGDLSATADACRCRKKLEIWHQR